MNEYSETFGIDISKNVFDCYGSTQGHLQFKNNELGFKKFETASQLCSYAGITPTIRESGSSVRGRARISKVGNRKLRNLLFLCSFSAYKYNKGCAAIFE